MRKSYFLAILILLIVCSMALTASALPTDRWSTSRYSNSYGNENRNENGQETNQIAQTQNQVTLTLYVLDKENGQLLSGVDVTVYDATGNNIGGATDSKGSIVLTGRPGTWQFTLAKDGYKTSNIGYAITKPLIAKTYLSKVAVQPVSSQIPTETAAYPQETAKSTQATETAQIAPTTQPVQSQTPVSLKIDVYETGQNETLLPGVQVTGYDAVGNSFSGITDSNGAVVLSGLPGMWQFTFSKEGYDTLNLNYNVNKTDEVWASLQRTSQLAPQSITQAASIPVAPQSQPQGQVDFAIYVHEDDLNGTALSGVQVTGQDAAGNIFNSTTDSDGAVVISGQPGTWQFTFAKEGYETLSGPYEVTGTNYGAVFLQSADQSTQSAIPDASEVSSSQTTDQQYSLQPTTQTISTAS